MLFQTLLIVVIIMAIIFSYLNIMNKTCEHYNKKEESKYED